MSTSINARDDLFDGGPLIRLQRSMGLVNERDRRAWLRARVFVALAWVMLAALAGFQLFVLHDPAAKVFFSDFAVYGRFLVAGPFLVLAERDCIPRFARIARHFLEGGFVIKADQDRYN